MYTYCVDRLFMVIQRNQN